MQQLTFCVAWSGFPVMLSGKPEKLFVQSYEQLMGGLFTLLELMQKLELLKFLELLEKMTLLFSDQIKLPGLKLRNVLEKRTL
jgi:hypothetical protein